MLFSIGEGTQTERLVQHGSAYGGWQHLIIWSCAMRAYCSPVGGGSSCLWLGEWGQSCGWLGWYRTASFWLETLAWRESWAGKCISAPLSGFENRGRDVNLANLVTNPGKGEVPAPQILLFELFYVEGMSNLLIGVFLKPLHIFLQSAIIFPYKSLTTSTGIYTETVIILFLVYRIWKKSFVWPNFHLCQATCTVLALT